MVRFPPNPSDGMLFEPAPGIIYIWNAGQSTWARVPLGRIPLATPVQDGLMSKEDLAKLESIILPPPQSTLQGEDCDIVFDSGTVILTSSDSSLDVSPSLDLNKTSTAWELHENTAGYNWTLNLDQFIQEVTALGNITQTTISGPDGFKGATGEPGIDRLDTGPVGKQGEPGANSPWPGSITPENSFFEVEDDKQNRAIVNVSTEKVSEDENYLVMTRANIGNPDACPTGLRPQDFNSPWILVLDQKEGSITRRLESTDDCAITCRICVSQVYYLNIETIIDTIETRFQARLDQMVFDKEKIVRDWLRVMSRLFNEQKYALCCALENCQTRKRNQDVRRYIEQSRIAAAQAKQALVISSSEDDKVTVPSDQECDLDEDRGEYSGGTNSRVVYGEECEQYLVTMSLSAKLHNTDPRTGSNGRWLEARLPPGDYMAEILDCCANYGRKLKPPPPPPPSPPPPPAPPPPQPVIQQPTQPSPPPPPVMVPYPPRRIYLGSITSQDGSQTEELYHDIPGGMMPAQQQPPMGQSYGGTGYSPITPITMPTGQLGAGGSVPPGLRVPFSNTPGGRKTAGELKCTDLELTGKVGNQPGDTPSLHYSGYISNNCTVIHGYAHSSKQRGCIPKKCPETTVEDTGGSNLSQANKYTGAVAILHYGTVPGNETGGERHISKVTRFPSLGPRSGYFEDLFAARTAYVGLTQIFNHSGGLIKVWLPDPDKLGSNNDGGVVVGIRSRKCVEELEEAGTDVTLTIPTLYIYRGSIEPENLVGSIDPYLSDLTHAENYDITGSDGSAQLTDGPLLEPELSKMFFVLANDGLGFYHVHHSTATSNKFPPTEEPGQAYTMRPTALADNTGWGAVNAGDEVDAVDEATPNDTNYILASDPNDMFIDYHFDLNALGVNDYEPYIKTGHILRVRARTVNVVDDPITLQVDFLDTTHLGNYPQKMFTVRSGSFTDTSYRTMEWELTEAQVDQILASNNGLTGYDPILVRITASGWVDDAAVEVRVSWMEFELPASKITVEVDQETPPDFQTTILSKYLVEGNPDPVEVEVGDDLNDIIKSQDPQGELFTASWNIDNETDGMVLSSFTTDEDDDWIITVDDMDFGDILQLIASSATGEELVLSQDVHGYPVPAQTEDVDPFILCRALTRSCNVQEGFGGRWSLGIINRVKGENFRICKQIPEWKLPPLQPGDAITPGLRDPETGEIVDAPRGPQYSWIRKPYLYAPEGQPCGADYCNVKWQYIIGSDGVVVPINRDVDPGPEIDGSRVNIAFVVDQATSNEEAFEFLGDRADDIMEYFRNSGVEHVAGSVVTFGGSESGGDPILRQDFTEDTLTITTAIDNAAPPPTGDSVATTTILCESWGYKHAVCPVPTAHQNPRNFRVYEKQSRSSCVNTTSGGAGKWWYDSSTRLLHVDNGCRAIFAYDYDAADAGTATTGDSPGLYAIQWSAETLNWSSDAVKIILFVTNDGSDHRATITVETVDASLKKIPIALFGVVNVNAIRTIVGVTSSLQPDGTVTRVTEYSDGSKTTTITHPDGTMTSSTSATSVSNTLFGIPDDINNPSEGGTGLCYENLGTMFSHEDMRNASLTESLVRGPGATSFWDQQPFIDFRVGHGNTNGGGQPVPLELTEEALDVIQTSNGFYTVAGRWLGGPAPRNPSISGAIVHLKSDITGNTIISSTITDNDGRFIFQIPTKFFPNSSVKFTVVLEMYNVRFNDPDGYWIVKTKSTNAGASQHVHISGGGLSEYGQDNIYSANGMGTKRLSGSPWSVRLLYGLHGGRYPSSLHRIANIRLIGGRFSFDLQTDDTPGGDLDFNDCILDVQYAGNSNCTGDDTTRTVTKTGSVLCESWGYSHASCAIPLAHENPRNFRVAQKQSRSSCYNTTSGGAGHWWYDSNTRLLHVDDGCRAIFHYEYDTVSASAGGSNGSIEPYHTTSRVLNVSNIYRSFVSVPGSGGSFTPATNCCGITSGVFEFTNDDINAVDSGYTECGGRNGFLQRLADAILNSIRDYVPDLPFDCGAPVHGGPATEYSKQEGIPMDAATLEGRILNIQASVLALPGTAIQCTIYDIQGRGIKMRSVSTLPTSAWEWHSWQVDNVDEYINPSANSLTVIQQIGNFSPGGSVNPELRPASEQSAARTVRNPYTKQQFLESRGEAGSQVSESVRGRGGQQSTTTRPTTLLPTTEEAVASGDPRVFTAAGRVDLLTRGTAIKLKDLNSLSFEFVNPDTGVICYFGTVRAAVEVVTNELTGATKVTMVDLATFEPFVEDINDPAGEIPLVVYGAGVPSDNTDVDDGSANAEATLTLTDNPAHRSMILVGGPIQTDSGGFVGGSQVINFVNALITDPQDDDYYGHQVLIGATLADTMKNLCDLINNVGAPDVTWNNAILSLGFPTYDFASNSDIICASQTATSVTLQAVTTGVIGNSHQAKVVLDTAGVMTFSPTNTFTGGVEPPVVVPQETRVDPTEEDYSGYLERFWTIAQPDDPREPNECSRWKEYCPDCTVVKCDNTATGSVQRQLIECVDKTAQMRVPLTKYLITPISPCESCQMHWKQVEWYERGWRTKACCGVHIEIDGVQWIVVKRSIGIDDTCGGGESENTPCIATFLNAGQGHPAIAWPTIDGEEFIGRPLSGFARFVKDPGLSDQIVEAIAKSQYVKARGDLDAGNVAERIPFILFPRSL